MKAILLMGMSLFLISCGKGGSLSSGVSERSQENLRDIKMSGFHTGEKWDGAVAIMYESEIFDRPALSFEIASVVVGDPCVSVRSAKKGVLVTIAKEASGNENEYDQYINFYDQDSQRSLSSPNLEYQYKIKDGVISSIGILFDVDDSDYNIEGYVDVVDCRTKNKG